RRLRVLVDAGGAIARSLGAPALVQQVLGALVPAVAETAVIVLRAGMSPSTEARWLHADDAARLRSESASGERRGMLEAGRERVLAAGPPETRPPGSGEPVRGLVLPLVAQQRTYGALAVVANGASSYSAADQGMFLDVANRAAIALENCRLDEEIRTRDRQ